MKLKPLHYIIGAVIIIAVILAGYWLANSNKNPYPELTPAVIEAKGGQAVVDKLISEYQAAKEQLQAAIDAYRASNYAEDQKPAELLFVRASNQAFYLNKYDEAIGYLDDFFDYYDKSELVLANLAHLYEAKENYQQAIDTYLQIYAEFNNQPQYHQAIMQDYIALNNREKVAEYYAEFQAAGYSSESIAQYLSQE